ncbi:MAG: T9SS type A sorting domain-containing protein [Sphingobacteriales bacterium JAD_PAG50586_3]|nr:MAG: T9SS type A sorting domain-containing protein [Sphingobacteriales bacterium JAD_PAG50586_3]
MNIKKFSLAIVALMASGMAYAQLDCSNGRYVDPPIFSTFTETTNIEFGQNVNINGQNQVLTMDVFEPNNDNLAQRPLIIFVHGGTFITGTKDDGDVTELCERFAKLGYVTASINYRLGMGIPSQASAAQALLRAVHDMKAAVRFFRKDAATTNTYRINPDYIIGGGSSAGGLTAVHLAYLDQNNEVPSYVDTTGVNGLEGNSGNPGYPSNIRAVVNLCGALADSSWLVAGDEPIVSVHGDEDATVPYNTATITVFGIPIIPVSGSRDIHARANHQGVPNVLKTFPGQDHVPYATNATYMDSTYWVVRDFLVQVVCDGLASNDEATKMVGKLSIYPNPATADLNIAIAGTSLKNTTVELIDISGRLVYETKITTDVTTHKINTANLTAGLYIVKTSSTKGVQTQKLVIQ